MALIVTIATVAAPVLAAHEQALSVAGEGGAMNEDLDQLARTAADTLVSALGTDSWEADKRRFFPLVGHERQMDTTRAALIATDGTGRDTAQQEQVRNWSIRLRDVLEDDPKVADALRDLLTKFGASPAASVKKKESTRGKTWNTIKWLSNSALVATVAGSLVLSGLLWIYHGFSQPPAVSMLTSLMNDEAASAQKHDISVVGRIYTPDAVVTDAGCQTPGVSQTWQGYSQIYARYNALPDFVWLRHLYAQVSWEPDNSQATTAAVTAETVGVLRSAASPAKSQSIVGHELWTFALVGGHWLVTSFTYNLCLPPSGA